MSQITLLDIKQAMKDQRFRDRLPPELRDDVEKYLQNPSCKCNMPLYVRIAKECKQQVQEYFPGKKIVDELEVKANNTWRVINCHINELESHLKKLPPGKKNLDIARYQDQVTVVINELEME